jgi:cyclic pyranopterin phosphate synthase
MPEDDYIWLPRQSILTFEETERLARLFVGLGAARLRLTGGEPLLRQELSVLVRMLARIPGLADLALTTNGILLGRHAEALRIAGMRRVTVSLDTLRPDRYRAMTRADRLAETLAGIAAARAAGFAEIKLNSVIVRGVNDDELLDLLAFGRRERAEIRFIEYMDVGGATRWAPDRVVSRREMLDRIQAAEGAVRPAPDQDPRAPAERFVLPDGTTFGVIASTTEPFCRTCDRSRLTADGVWLLCLYSPNGVNLKDLLRGGASDGEIADLIRRVWSGGGPRRGRAGRRGGTRCAVPDRPAPGGSPQRDAHQGRVT